MIVSPIDIKLAGGFCDALYLVGVFDEEVGVLVDLGVLVPSVERPGGVQVGEQGVGEQLAALRGWTGVLSCDEADDLRVDLRGGFLLVVDIVGVGLERDRVAHLEAVRLRELLVNDGLVVVVGLQVASADEFEGTAAEVVVELRGVDAPDVGCVAELFLLLSVVFLLRKLLHRGVHEVCRDVLACHVGFHSVERGDFLDVTPLHRARTTRGAHIELWVVLDDESGSSALGDVVADLVG